MKCVVILLAAVAHLLATPLVSQAAWITDHAAVYIKGSGSATLGVDTGLPSGIYYDSYKTGNTLFVSGKGYGNGNGNETASSIVHTNPSPEFIGGQASSSSDKYGAAGFAISAGTYRDIIYLTGPGSLPSQILLTFHYSGTYSATTGGPEGFGGNLDFGASVTPTVSGFENIQDLSGFPLRFRNSGAGSGSFSGELTFISPYDPVTGGYDFQVMEFVRSNVYYGNGFIQWNDPLQVDFVRNVDGSPLTGYGISFDSGLQLSPDVATTPAPNGLVLMGTAGLCTGLYRRFRHRVG